MFVVVLGTWTEDALCSLHEEHGGPAGLQPASNPGLHSPALHTDTPLHLPPHPIPGPPKTKTETAKTLAENVSEVECTGRLLARLGWLALIYIYIYIYKYVCVCVCFFCVGAYVMRSCSGTDSVFRKSQE
jgi:hypothetical protein